MQADRYQYALIGLGIIATAMMGIFFYREIFPEYRIYQNDYLALEEFRSSYTGQPLPPFKEGVKQIVHERSDNGPAEVQRCTSCHVALDLSYFSPTTLQYDANGAVKRDADGTPTQAANPEYIFAKLDEKIAWLRSVGGTKELTEARRLESLKSAEVGERVYDVTKVLASHPLIGRETRPFEFHPLDEYGCVSCHNGNPNGLTTEKAHGPVYDGEYETEFVGPVPKFTETDATNDPIFSRVFNSKPGHELLFQTAPIFVGNLIEAKCMQCHKSSSAQLQGISEQTHLLIAQKEKDIKVIEDALFTEKSAATAFLILRHMIQERGVAGSFDKLDELSTTYHEPAAARQAAAAQAQWLLLAVGGKMGLQKQDSQAAHDVVQDKISNELTSFIGSTALLQQLYSDTAAIPSQNEALQAILTAFLEKEQNNKEATGTLFTKQRQLAAQMHMLALLNAGISDSSSSSNDMAATQGNKVVSEIDKLTKHFHRGEELYLNQACYACHKIAGFSRGGVGPELTQEGKSYPWYIKQKIVWPQSDLKTSTMPNYRLDHEEQEDLMTFLLAQQGGDKISSAIQRKLAIQQWEGGKRLPWEAPIAASQIRDMRYSMTLFATEGCAACHRLKGFSSDIGYKAETLKDPDSQKQLIQQQSWFRKIFPEMSTGKQITSALSDNSKEIDDILVKDVRKGSILEEIEGKYPGTLESYYAPFKYAMRAKNHYFTELAKRAATPQERQSHLNELDLWKERVRRVLLAYIQEYGLGRLVGPRPNWSGIFRSDEWLMEHFRNPAAHVPRSIMPAFPFDDSKFYALTFMLDTLAKQNSELVHAIWQRDGFSPERAYEIFCSQCHGVYQQGNGPVAEWIYPIPKNLRNAEFLQNLTRQQAIQSIIHGVKGTPMPPWGEVAAGKPVENDVPVLNKEQIVQLVDWLYSRVSTGPNIDEQRSSKWQYGPTEVLRELEQEHHSAILKKNNPPAAAAPANGADLTADLFQPLLDLFSTPVPLHSRDKREKNGPPLQIDDIFDIVANPVAPLAGQDKNGYYIKKTLFTPENIATGAKFFSMNCAVCHGQQADGAGTRADAMKEAKPRMLINLDWLQTRDDVRLLRSIKYGVAGTAMTPWGDMTNGLQRLQLVIYIRSLSAEKEQRDALAKQIYRSFDEAKFLLDQARIAPAGAAASAGISIKKELQNEQRAYEDAGRDLLPLLDEGQWKKFLTLVQLDEGKWTVDKEGALIVRSPFYATETAKAIENELTQELQRQYTELDKKKTAAAGQIATAEQASELERLATKMTQLKRVENRFIEAMSNAARSRKEQEKLLKAA